MYSADRKVPVSYSERILQAFNMNEVEKERSSIVNKQHVLSLLVYFSIFMICDTAPFLPFDIDVPSKILVAVKVVTAFGFLTVLSQILMQIRSAPETSMID